MGNTWVFAIPIAIGAFAIGFLSCWFALREVEKENMRLRFERDLAHLETAALEARGEAPQGSGEEG